MQMPIVNINGTSREMLLAVNENALEVLRRALYALEDTAPHGRDYQTDSSGESYRKALDEHLARNTKLLEVFEELTCICEFLAE